MNSILPPHLSPHKGKRKRNLANKHEVITMKTRTASDSFTVILLTFISLAAVIIGFILPTIDTIQTIHQMYHELDFDFHSHRHPVWVNIGEDSGPSKFIYDLLYFHQAILQNSTCVFGTRSYMTDLKINHISAIFEAKNITLNDDFSNVWYPAAFPLIMGDDFQLLSNNSLLFPANLRCTAPPDAKMLAEHFNEKSPIDSNKLSAVWKDLVLSISRHIPTESLLNKDFQGNKTPLKKRRSNEIKLPKTLPPEHKQLVLGNGMDMICTHKLLCTRLFAKFITLTADLTFAISHRLSLTLRSIITHRSLHTQFDQYHFITHLAPSNDHIASEALNTKTFIYPFSVLFKWVQHIIFIIINAIITRDMTHIVQLLTVSPTTYYYDILTIIRKSTYTSTAVGKDAILDTLSTLVKFIFTCHEQQF